MTKPDLGTKRVCPTTGRKFYDLNRDPIVSPYTGQSFPRSAFEPAVRGPAPRARSTETEEEETDSAAGPEMVSLDDVEASENEKAETNDDDVDLGGDDESSDDDEAFIVEEEDSGDDVSDLIDSDIENDEET